MCGTPAINDNAYANMPPLQLRKQIRANDFEGPSTSGVCKGYAQANLIVLPTHLADDFRLLCQRNPVPCPLVAVGRPGDPSFDKQIAAECDIRFDIPFYNVYEDGKHVRTTTDVEEYWKSDSVAFLIGCSYSFEAALSAAGLMTRHTEIGRNVPMYKTTVLLDPAGAFHGHMVVSLRPYRPEDIEQVRKITQPFVATHGEPIAWGAEGLAKLGITDIMKPDFGDPPEMRDGEAPVFWGCGVTPQLAVMDSKIQGTVISHAPGFMLVLDLKDEDVCRSSAVDEDVCHSSASDKS